MDKQREKLQQPGSGRDTVWQKAATRWEIDANNMQMMQARKCAGGAAEEDVEKVLRPCLEFRLE